ncbi:rhodanese-like domain-containing protein [Clostridium thermarum]|uniref:rhodanese-like domain-containing protein n=1 Tax=Clostridium thermarum TaxID=1716543 RepID=UPI00111F1ADA|nr:rhodanese-like domain-containing protein [Clostridium thermarum]
MKNKFRNIFYAAAGIVLLGVLSGCSSKRPEEVRETPAIKGEEKAANTKRSFSNITPEEAKKRLDSEDGIILLDVRTKQEYDSGHIEDALLIPVDVLQVEAEDSLKDKNAHIFIYCRSGNRSVTAANILFRNLI